MILEHQSKNKKILIAIFIILIIGGIFFICQKTDNSHENIFCAQDAKLCADGSYVGRTSPDCEFAACPADEANVIPAFRNEQLEKAIINYLLRQKTFSWQNEEDSFNFCAIENLDADAELFPLSIWAYCAEYLIANDELKTISGYSGPVKVNYPNELSYYNLNEFSHEAPGDGAMYSADVKRIFAENIHEKIFNFSAEKLAKANENKARANFHAWEAIKQALSACEVEGIFQAHSLEVEAALKNGAELKAIEPQIDEIFAVADLYTAKCGKIIMATE